MVKRNSFLDFAIRDYKARHPKARRLKRAPVPLHALRAEHEYRRFLFRLIMQCQQAFRVIVKPQFKGNLLDSSVRLDDDYDDLVRILAQYGLAVETIMTANEVRRTLRELGQTIDLVTFTQVSKQVKTVTGLDVPRFEPRLSGALNLWVEENAKLIKNVGEDIKQKISGRVSNGALQGLRWEELVDGIERDLKGQRGVFKSTRTRARLIARDQVGSFNGTLTRIRQQSIGGTRYRWLAVMDERTRDSHRDRDGKVYTWENPSHQGGHPGMEIRCRCVAQMVFSNIDNVTSDEE